MEKSVERRKNHRYPISAEVTIKANGEFFPATATNISRGGIGIQSLRSLPPGEQASILIDVSEEAALISTTDWLLHTLINNLDAYKIGFKLHMITYQGAVHDNVIEVEDIVREIASKYAKENRSKMN